MGRDVLNAEHLDPSMDSFSSYRDGVNSDTDEGKLIRFKNERPVETSPYSPPEDSLSYRDEVNSDTNEGKLVRFDEDGQPLEDDGSMSAGIRETAFFDDEEAVIRRFDEKKPGTDGVKNEEPKEKIKMGREATEATEADADMFTMRAGDTKDEDRRTFLEQIAREKSRKDQEAAQELLERIKGIGDGEQGVRKVA